MEFANTSSRPRESSTSLGSDLAAGVLSIQVYICRNSLLHCSILLLLDWPWRPEVGRESFPSVQDEIAASARYSLLAQY